MKGSNWKGKTGAKVAAVGTAVVAVAKAIETFGPVLPTETIMRTVEILGLLGSVLFGGGMSLSAFGIRQAQGDRP